ncbi:hypothetical protein PIB30_040195 [Stylosanthes scabra]|uniref:Uncharacterized protein n=1 Tax=Stylosanthes scabra TaxID=79078 RepID=A0ABU6QEL6_9FABA|nr:hypothetical protein [Stylosanthes scabra]
MVPPTKYLNSTVDYAEDSSFEIDFTQPISLTGSCISISSREPATKIMKPTLQMVLNTKEESIDKTSMHYEDNNTSIIIKEGYTEMLSHHNINGDALILATYYGGCFFRYKITPCGEDELIPHMMSNCSPIHTHLDPAAFQLGPIVEPSIIISSNETNNLREMSQPSTTLAINSNHQNTLIHTAVEDVSPPLKNLSKEEKDDHADSLIQEKNASCGRGKEAMPNVVKQGIR